VVLENIGCFRSLDLKLSSGWNVLLGNNGCGKSTILRAIALGLCGNDRRTEAAAQDLLRCGEFTGTIELHMGEEEVYRTTLSREGSLVTIKARRPTQLQLGQLAVLGYPAMRGVSVSESKGPDKGRDHPGPHVGDVLPLLNESTDTRMDSLKQWIVNQETWALTGREGSREANEQMDSFFRIMQALMSGVKFGRGTVDKNFRVLIQTEENEPMPVTFISQGMSSLVGWAGHALQRLSEFKPEGIPPEQGHAFVLVDELDAHMHPVWQVQIAPRFKAHFENLQVIATTHSPLIVANLEEGEVHVVERKGKDVTIQQAPNSFKGWRFEQILMSFAFGMPGVRGLESNQAHEEYLRLD
jgi:hypothetical protein